MSSKVARSHSVPRRRREWDATVHDLSVYKPSRPEIEARKERMRSANAAQARIDLDERQQRLAAGDLSQVLGALQPASTESPRPARDERPLRQIEQVHAQLNALEPEALRSMQPKPAEDDAAPRPPPDLAGGHAIDSSVPEPVVDLDREIALFKLRAGERLNSASGASAPAPPQPDDAPASLMAAPERPPVAPMAPPPAAASPAAAQAAAAAAAHDNGPKGPDALGLGRLQHACGWLESAIGEYEASRSEGFVPTAPSETESRATDTQPGLARPPAAVAAFGSSAKPTRPRKAAAGVGASQLLGGSGGRAANSSFGACNERLVEMVSRLVGHLRTSQAELAEQARLREEADAQLGECRAMLGAHKASAEAASAQLREQVGELREAHERTGAQTQKRLAALEASRASAYARNLMGSRR